MSGLHARVGFSKLGMAVACAGSVSLQEILGPVPETEEEAEGTAAHLPAMAHAAGNPWPVGAHFDSGGKPWVVDHDMFIGAKMWAAGMGGPHGNLRLEDAVRASHIHDEHCWGTPDGWRLMEPGRYNEIAGHPWTPPAGAFVLRVGDYKFGHRYVEVFENYQLVGGTVGVMERLNLPDLNLWLEWVVVQPRSYHKDGPIRVWRAPASSIRPLVNIAHHAVADAVGPNPTCKTGTHCLDCKATSICPALRLVSAAIVDYTHKATPDKLDAAAMGVELKLLTDAMKRLEARKVGLAASVESVLRAGQAVPMWHMEPGQSRRTWFETVTPEEIAAMGDLFNIELRKPMAVCTPMQAIDAGVDEAIIKEYADRPKGVVRLALDKAADVRKIFNRSAE